MNKLQIRTHNFFRLEKKVKNCSKCPLHKNRRNAVFGEGSMYSKIMLIGEAPGNEEDLQGKPFVGKAGMLLNDLLRKSKLERKKVFVTNLVKCHPPKNRLPQQEEIQTCTKNYLSKQIEIINPDIIITLGRTSSAYFLKKCNLPFTKISKIHGKTFDINCNDKKIKLICMYHPAYVLYNPQKKSTLESDFQKIQIINENT